MYLIVNCPRNSKMASNWSKSSDSWVIGQNIIFTVLINNLKTTWPTKTSMPFLIPWTIYFKMHALFYEKVLMIFEIAHKTYKFQVKVQHPLKGKKMAQFSVTALWVPNSCNFRG